MANIAGDNPYNRFMTKLFNIVELNVLWLITCIPVLTIGDATSAMYFVMLKMVKNEEGVIYKDYFRFFKENFRKSIPYTLWLLLVTGILTFDLHVTKAGISYGGLIVLVIVAVCIFSYVWALFASYDNTVRGTFNNAWRLMATHLPQSLAILAIQVIPFLWLILKPESFARVFWIWFFVGAGAACYVSSLLLRPVMDEIRPEET